MPVHSLPRNEDKINYCGNYSPAQKEGQAGVWFRGDAE